MAASLPTKVIYTKFMPIAQRLYVRGDMDFFLLPDNGNAPAQTGLDSLRTKITKDFQILTYWPIYQRDYCNLDG